MEPIKEKTKYKIEVDRDTCISAATCVVLAPDVFELDEDGIAVVKAGFEKTDFNTVLLAAQSCPTQAIRIFDENGKQIFPVL